MKTKIFLVIFTLAIFSNLMATDSTVVNLLDKKILIKYYIGMLYMNLNPKVYENNDDVSVRAAIWPKFNLAYGWDFHIVAVYKNGGGLGAPFVQKTFSDGFVRIGWQPQLIRTLNCPSSVSDGSHFQPLSKAVIPGLGNGILINYKSAYLAGYVEKQGFRGSVATKQKIGPINFTLSGFMTDYTNYINERANGWVAKIDNELFEVMYFQTNIDSNRTRSLAINYNLPNRAGTYISSVYENQKWRQLALGVYKYYTELFPSGLKINYMICADYLYSEVKPPSFNLYFQIWLD